VSQAVHLKRVLLCRPSHFTVDYIINPHMQPYSVDGGLALRQWQTLVGALENQGIKVDVIEQEPDVPDMVFATDQGIVRDGAVLLANFRYDQRKKERHYYREWFRQHGLRLRALSNVFAFEGGDALFFGDMLLVGTGFRASIASCEELSEKLQIDVFPLRLADPYFYHLDMCFLPLDTETAFYYPPAFSPNSRHLLQKLVKDLHEFSHEEAAAYAANSLVNGTTVTVQAGITTFVQKLQQLGRQVVEVDVSEFQKAGGGIHCLINALEWRYQDERH
jgi:N-dimethylarginine dimethylaminohydrolase